MLSRLSPSVGETGQAFPSCRWHTFLLLSIFRPLLAFTCVVFLPLKLCATPCFCLCLGAPNPSLCLQLIELYGEDARLFLLQCLVEETGFKEQRTHTHHGNKDAQKVHVRRQISAVRC